MKLFFILIIFFSCGLVRAQGSRIGVEPWIGAQHIHHHNCTLDDPSQHRGFCMSAGFRVPVRIVQGFHLVPGLMLQNIAGDNFKFPFERKFTAHLRYQFAPFKRNRKWICSVESGIHYNRKSGTFRTPFYLGISHQINYLTRWELRFRLPAGQLLSDQYGEFTLIDFGMEGGIVLQIFRPDHPSLESSGNPFILQ